MKTIIIDGEVVAENVPNDIFLKLSIVWDLKDVAWYSFGGTVWINYHHGDLRVFERTSNVM